MTILGLNILGPYLDYGLSLGLCGSEQKMENSSRDANTRPSYQPSEKHMQVKKQQLEPDMEQWNGPQMGKEYINTILSPCLFN